MFRKIATSYRGSALKFFSVFTFKKGFAQGNEHQPTNNQVLGTGWFTCSRDQQLRNGQRTATLGIDKRV